MRPIICLTPVKNEEWILSKFLSAASLWADHIVVADQNSSDHSIQIAESFPKVILVKNEDDKYDELGRQRLLIDTARKISSEALLVALDSDEFLAGTTFKYPELETIRRSQPGTNGWLQWQNISPCLTKTYPAERLPFIYVDDGREHTGRALHSPRLPFSAEGPNLYFKRVPLLHFHYVDWEKMRSKIRFYQCLERIEKSQKDSIELYRFYNKWQVLEALSEPINPAWIDEYARRGVDLTSTLIYGGDIWNKRIFDFLEKHGCQIFSDIQIWDIDWVEYARKNSHPFPERFKDPRNFLQKKIHSYLYRTQTKQNSKFVQKVDKRLQSFF